MKFLKRIIPIFIAIFILLILLNFNKVKRLYGVVNFFDKELINRNFYNSTDYFPAYNIKKSTKPYHFKIGKTVKLPQTFVYKGKKHTSQAYLDSIFATSLAILKNDELIFEQYYNGNAESTTHISWSVAKSIVSVLLGIAIEEGYINSITDNVDLYLPELKGSGYEGVKIVDVLQMSSGIGFNEDYGNFWSDINRWSRGFALGASQDDFAKSLKRIRKPGTVHDYVSLDTHVLGMLIVKTTEKRLSDYMQEKLWEPIGAEYDAQWNHDDKKMEIAFGGLNITLRDYLKFGRLILNYGNWNGKQIVSKQWILDSKTVNKPHLKISSDGVCAYGYQWWLPIGDGNEMLAKGHSGQYIYINLKTNIVIAQNSANYLNNDKSHLFSNFSAVLAFFRSVNNSI